MIDHEQAMNLAAIALDFTLTPGESAELDRHLAWCPTCRATAAAYRADKAILARLPESDSSGAVRSAVIEHALHPRA